MEVWKDIPGWEGRYQASDHGSIRSLRGKGKVLKPSLNGKGYQRVDLYWSPQIQKCYVHRLVMLTFVGESYHQVNHINHIKIDNRLENLEYVSQRENQGYETLRHKKYVGAVKTNPNYWESRITINGKRFWLGGFPTEEEAANAYQKALIEHGVTNKYVTRQTDSNLEKDIR